MAHIAGNTKQKLNSPKQRHELNGVTAVSAAVVRQLDWYWKGSNGFLRFATQMPILVQTATAEA